MLGLNPLQLALGGTVVAYLGSVAFLKISPLLEGRIGFKRSTGLIFLGSVRLTDQSRSMPTQILGTTGSGKSVCIEHMLWQDLKRGMGAIIIDPKGEREFYERVRAYCTKIGREADLSLLSATYPDESVHWNPCGLGNVSELQTKFFNSAIYSEPHYAKACEAALLKAFGELVRLYPDGFSISHLVAELERTAKETKEKNIEGLFYDLFNLANGEWGGLLGCGTSENRKDAISILDVVQNNKILFVDLPTEGKLVQSSRIGRLLTQEIILISGLRKRYPVLKQKSKFAVFIDEFDAFGTESFISFLNKGRSSGFLVTLAHQTLSDLARVSPTFDGQVRGNINAQIIFRLNNAEDCEALAKSFGTQVVTKRTYQTQSGIQTGASSNREGQEFKVHPDEIKRLKTGHCYFVQKDRNLVRKIRIPKPLDLSIRTATDAPAGVLVRGLGEPPKKIERTLASELPVPAQKADEDLFSGLPIRKAKGTKEV